MILAICVVVDESKCLDIPILEFSIICVHLPFSLGYKLILRLLVCPVHPGSLDLMSITLAAVICDADDPCSANTAHDPQSSWLQLRILEMTEVH